jgi:hypothetical protein
MPAHTGKAHVQQDEVELVTLTQFDDLFPVVNRHGVISVKLQPLTKNLSRILTIVGNANAKLVHLSVRLLDLPLRLMSIHP